MEQRAEGRGKAEMRRGWGGRQQLAGAGPFASVTTHFNLRGTASPHIYGAGIIFTAFTFTSMVRIAPSPSNNGQSYAGFLATIRVSFFYFRKTSLASGIRAFAKRENVPTWRYLLILRKGRKKLGMGRELPKVSKPNRIFVHHSKPSP